MRNAPVYFFWIAFAVVLGLGNLLLIFHISETFLFPFLFVLGAALPTLGVVAYSSGRLGSPISLRRMLLAIVLGSTLSTVLALILETALSFFVYFFLPPLRFLGDSGSRSGGFFSPLIVFFLIMVAIQAPIPEEFTKGLSAALSSRRARNEREALLVGICCGAGFAILENMLYEGLYAPRGGVSWGGVTLLRGIGSVLHPLATGIISLGLFRARSGAMGELFKAALTAVGIHTLWNGGFVAFVYLTGLEYYSTRGATLSLYGTPISMLLVVFLLALAFGLWWVLARLTKNLAQGIQPQVAPLIVSSRALAAWAMACAAVIIPIGAALATSWSRILSALLSGPAK